MGFCSRYQNTPIGFYTSAPPAQEGHFYALFTLLSPLKDMRTWPCPVRNANLLLMKMFVIAY